MAAGSFESVLARDGVLVYRVEGRSMLPMLRGGRDAVIIRPASGRLRPMDVALYRSGGKYVLHRVIAVGPQGYRIRGDNTYRLERGVTDGDVLGVLAGFVRKGRRYEASDWRWRLYGRAWCALYPLRAVTVRVLRRIRRRRGEGR